MVKKCIDLKKIGNVELCPSNPVDNISKEDVDLLVKSLNAKSRNYTYDLPTEEEWEYFARGGTQTNYFWGSFPDQVAIYASETNDPKRSSPVMSHKPNGFNLYDTAGNVWELTKTKYIKYYYDNMEKNGKMGTELESEFLVIRGGGWNSRTDHFRSSYRGKIPPKTKGSDLGVRLIDIENNSFSEKTLARPLRSA